VLNGFFLAFLAVFFLFWAGWTLIETRKVRDGWKGYTLALWSTKKSRTGTHEQFVATCRRGLTFAGWFGSVWGVFITASGIVLLVLVGERRVATVAFGLAVLLVGLVSFWCRRSLKTPAEASPA
jgi:hypothetical protein